MSIWFRERMQTLKVDNLDSARSQSMVLHRDLILWAGGDDPSLRGEVGVWVQGGWCQGSSPQSGLGESLSLASNVSRFNTTQQEALKESAYLGRCRLFHTLSSSRVPSMNSRGDQGSAVAFIPFCTFQNVPSWAERNSYILKVQYVFFCIMAPSESQPLHLV